MLKATASKSVSEPLDLGVWAKQRVVARKRRQLANHVLTAICIVVALFIWWWLTR